jgi:hypothetical protein
MFKNNHLSYLLLLLKMNVGDNASGILIFGFLKLWITLNYIFLN